MVESLLSTRSKVASVPSEAIVLTALNHPEQIASPMTTLSPIAQGNTSPLAALGLHIRNRILIIHDHINWITIDQIIGNNRLRTERCIVHGSQNKILPWLLIKLVIAPLVIVWLATAKPVVWSRTCIVTVSLPCTTFLIISRNTMTRRWLKIHYAQACCLFLGMVNHNFSARVPIRIMKQTDN